MASVKNHRLNVRVDDADDALFRRAAESAGESLSSFVLQGARERSERVLADRSRFVLDEEQWAAFHAALDEPARDVPAVRELFGRPRPA
ncbi:DUF1778 domain-containing protein [Patulibacter sp. NPDC049589]|uniref:type II toxin-antitoxin system TacA family antitoxin n=1 Tax=Patulibacter sp. NPDC049589 TaxID=3154731 RepID=UPI003430AF4F